MQLSELIEKETIGVVVDKTNISPENLLSLIEEDFRDLNRVNALGFVSILKREYGEGIKLEKLESSIKGYFTEHVPLENEPILITAEKTESSSGFFKWSVIVLLLGGLWYLYNGNKLDSVLNNNTESTKSELKDTEVLKSDVSHESATQSVVVNSEANESKVEIQVEKALSTIENHPTKKSKEETNSSITTPVLPVEVVSSVESVTEVVVPKGEDSPILEADEEAKRIASDIENAKKEENQAPEEVAKNNQQESIKEIKESMKEIAKIEEPVADEEKQVTVIQNITVNPRVNLWFGFINLDTKKKIEYMTTDSKAIDISGQRWLLLTGHGRVTVATDSKSIELNDRAKHYFYMDSDEIREIDGNEFRELNGGRNW
jgi:hypothetical protein